MTGKGNVNRVASDLNSESTVCSALLLPSNTAPLHHFTTHPRVPRCDRYATHPTTHHSIEYRSLSWRLSARLAPPDPPYGNAECVANHLSIHPSLYLSSLARTDVVPPFLPLPSPTITSSPHLKPLPPLPPIPTPVAFTTGRASQPHTIATMASPRRRIETDVRCRLVHVVFPSLR